MRKLLLGVSAALLAFGASAAPQSSKLQSDRLFPFAPKAKAELGKNVAGLSPSMAKTKAQSLPAADASGYLNGPKGAIWFYTMEYQGDVIDHGSYTEKIINGFKITVYDDKFNEVGSVEDTYQLQEGETKIAQFSIGPDITQKFFNTDAAYEIMMGVAVNTDVFVNNYRTFAYSIGKNDRIAEFDGYYCSAVNTATDDWSEKFWITFVTEEDTDTPDVNGVVNVSDYRFRTFKSAGYSGMGDAVIDARFPMVTVAGADAIPFIANVSNGTPYFSVNHLKYSWYENPYDYTNDNPTQDNELIVDIYSPASAWASTVDKYSTTTIPLGTTLEDLYFLYFGNFSYNDDLNFNVNADGAPVLYITRAHSSQGGDTFAYDYEVYDAAPKGQTAQGIKKFTVAQGTSGGYFMADIAGFDPQVMFIDSDGAEGLVLNFVNPLNGVVEHSINPYVDPENPQLVLNYDTNRIPRNGSYVYYAAQTRGTADENGHTHTYVIFVDPVTGTLVGKDDVDLGSNVEYAQLYSGYDTFDPYIFNLDDNREYMALVKRRAPSGVGTVEELVVVSTDPDKGILLTAGPDDTKGALANIFFANLEGDVPKLIVLYQASDWRLTLDSYDLPLVAFEAGSGTAEDPYQISTVGGLKQISSAPAAHYAVVNDINADGYSISQKNFDFKGSLDGRDHIISNLKLSGYGLIPTMTTPADATDELKAEGRLVNLTFLNPEFEATKDDQGLLVGHMTGGLVQNVHVYGGKINSEMSVGGLAGQMSMYGKILDSSFHGDITSTGNGVGGIVINTMTSAQVRACAFKGNITGAQSVGGIVSSTYNNAGQVADCHVNANIKGTNTVGGIVGGSARAIIRNCHVQGTLEATQAASWGGGPKLGGIVGQLDRSYANPGSEDGEAGNNANDAVIQGCYVNLTAMTFSGTLPEEEYEGQNDSMHRIVGWSSVNDYPEEAGYDPETWEVIYGDPAPAEAMLKNNYAVATLMVGNDAVRSENTTTEGASVATDQTGGEFFRNLGWLYGYDFENPWNMTGDQFNPSLYFEGGLPVMTPASVTIKVDEVAVLSLVIVGEELSEELLGGFTCEISNESIAELSGMETGADGEILLTVKGLSEGSTELTCGMNGKMAKALIYVDKKEESGVDDIIADKQILSFNGHEVIADGCTIEVFGTTGVRMLTGNDRLVLTNLQGGIYIVTAIDANGTRSSLKISIR